MDVSYEIGRIDTAQGAAATADFIIEFEDLR